MDITKLLPEDCISKILSFTSPKDASRSALVSSAFQVAADSDAVWESFLPSDYKEIIAQSTSPTLNSLPRKQIYIHLCDHPLLFVNGIMSFALEKVSGKKCYMVGAKGLKIVWRDTPQYWNWISLPQSRFPQVAELKLVWWLEVEGRLRTKLLSPKTTYSVFFIFKFHGFEPQGFRERYINLSVTYEGSINESCKRVILDPLGDGARQREDGWMEVEMGDFFNEDGDDNIVVCRLWEFGSFIKKDIIVEGIEFKPKNNG